MTPFGPCRLATLLILTSSPLLAQQLYSVLDYGAKGNGILRTDGSMNVGSATLSSASGSFSAADVGKYIQVIGAGPGGTMLSGVSISANAANLSAAPGSFAQTDVGRGIAVAGAGAGGQFLVTSIVSVTSASSVTLKDTAKASVSGVASFYGAMTLEASIQSVQSATSVTLSANAAASISGATYSYGTDDHAAIQAALDAAGQAGGGTVSVPQPQSCPSGAVCGYVVKASDQTSSNAPAALKIRYNNVSLQGAGPQTNLFCRGAWALYTNTVQFPGQTATIRGHCLMLGDSTGPLGPAGESVANSTISKLRFYGMTNGNTLTNYFSPTDPPLTTTGDGWDETHKAIYLYSGGTFSNIKIDSVFIQDFKGENIFGGGSPITGMVISNSTITNFNGDGISMLAADLQVLNNTITNGSNAGVENSTVGSGSAALVRQLYQGNTIANMPREAIVVVGVDTTQTTGVLQIINNTFDTISQGGPSIAVAAIYITTQGNGNLAPGNITISGNTCHDCNVFASLQAGPNIQVTGNTFIVDHYNADSFLGVFFPITNETVSGNTGYLTSAAAAQGLVVRGIYNIYPAYGALAWQNVNVTNNHWNFPGSPNYTFITNGGSGWSAISRQNILWQGETCTGCTYPDANHGLFNLGASTAILPFGPVVHVAGNYTPVTATIDASKEVDGAQLQVVNDGTQPVTFQSDANLALASPVTLASGASLSLQYSRAQGKFTSGAPVTVSVSVSLSPTSSSLSARQTQQFAATVTGSTNQQVAWSLSPAGSGAISSTGLYTAPSSITAGQTVTVKAASAADPSKSASASVTLTPVSIAITPTSASLAAGQTQQFTFSVQGSTNQQVIWSLSPAGAGSLSASGLYTAPATISAVQTVMVTATSAADSTKSAGASISLISVSNISYSYGRSITIAHAAVPNTDQTNFPVLIRGTYSFLANAAYGGRLQNSNGYDLIFTSDSAGQHRLNWEIQSYNPATGAVSFWVQAPLLSHTADTLLYMFYGKSNVATFQGNSAGVWDSSFVAVYHLSDNAGNTNVADSTANKFAGVSTANTNLKAYTGPDGYGLTFNGSSDYIRAVSGFNGSSPITLEGWVKLNAWPNTGYGGYVAAKGRQYFVEMLTDNGGAHGVVAGTYSGPYFLGTAKALDSGFAGTFHQITETWDGTNWNLYIDGALSAQTNALGLAASVGEPFIIGAQTYSGGNPFQFLNGVIGEVRVSSTARSDNWIAAQYNNLHSPAGFYSIATEVPGTAGVTVALSPSSVALSARQTQQFSATVSGSSNQQVTWSLSPAGVGTVSAAGLYTAPATVTAMQTVALKATSAADTTKSASASISLTSSAAATTVSVSPAAVTLSAGKTQQFTATVTGSSNQQVTWSLSPAAGTLSAAGLYTAPASIASAQTVTVKVTSAADTTKSATASVTLTVTSSSVYGYRRLLTLAHGQVAGSDQSNFPVLIQGVYPTLANVAHGGHVQSANGYDIVFSSDSAASHLLNWEVESYNPSTGALSAWVQMPNLSRTADTPLYLSYGNASITAPQGHPAAVWDSAYVAVYHLSDNAAGTNVADSTANAYTGTAAVSTTAKTTAGQDAAALSFNGSSDYIRMPVAFNAVQPFTMEAWVKLNAWPNNGYSGFAGAKGQQYFLDFATDNGGAHGIVAGSYSGAFFAGTAKSLDASFAGSFHHLAAGWDGAYWNLYIDGQLAAQSASAQGPSVSAEPFAIGGQTYSGGVPFQFLNGIVDEWRTSSVTRSPGWIATEYNNQTAPGSFYSVGAEVQP